jgi:arsenate reductase (glutaredoxin)
MGVKNMIKIYHNPKCGTSRNTLALIKNSGENPEVIEYLINPPTKTELKQLIADMGEGVRAVIRTKEAIYAALNMQDEGLSEDALIDLMLAHPILINRPVVVTPLGTKLCRPSELVLDILPNPQLGAFAKEDGERVVDASGKRLV